MAKIIPFVQRLFKTVPYAGECEIHVFPVMNIKAFSEIQKRTGLVLTIDGRLRKAK